MGSDDAANAAKDIADRADAAAQSTKSATRDFAARTKDAAADLYSQTKEQVREAAGRLPDGASDAIAAGRATYGKSSDAVGRQIAKQPIEALLLAGAIGYLVGWATNKS